MRLLVNNFDNVRIFKDRSLFGLPRWIIECTDPDFGFRNEIVLSGIWYKHEQVLKIARLCWHFVLLVSYDVTVPVVYAWFCFVVNVWQTLRKRNVNR